MVNINSVEGIESLIEKRTRPLKGQIRELQTELIKLKQALTIPDVVVPKGTLCHNCDEPLTEGVNLDYCTNNWCGA
tara:strand:+ start:474 stop:701 length:228 start_codon:yes stop_codon:yes gene_type:complete